MRGKGELELGVPAEVLDARQTAALDPGVTMDIAGAVYFPKDCHLEPERFMACSSSDCGRPAAELLYDAEVTGWRTDGATAHQRSAPRTAKSRPTNSCLRRLMVARHSSHELGLRFPMQAGKGYSLTLPQPVELPQLCSILTEARVAVTPMGGRLRFGGTMEIAGLNEDINPRRVAGIIKAVPQVFPEVRPGRFRRHQAVARPAALLAGRPAVSRPHARRARI